jgi:Predicted phosphohydrolases
MTIFLLIILAAVISLCTYARYEYGNIKVKNLSLKAEDKGLSGIKIVFASDFQYDLSAERRNTTNTKLFQKAIDMILKQKPDLILLGGDVSTYSANLYEAVPFLSQLSAPLGVYSVFGNHDYFVRKRLVEALPNIKFLEDEEAIVHYKDTHLSIFGVEDLRWRKKNKKPAEIPEKNGYRILLSHQPDYFELFSQEQRDRMDLMLCGHTHGGMVTFFGLFGFPPIVNHVTAYGEEYRYGENESERGRIYTTSGLGGQSIIFPMRFACAPEILVLEN